MSYTEGVVFTHWVYIINLRTIDILLYIFTTNKKERKLFVEQNKSSLTVAMVTVLQF